MISPAETSKLFAEKFGGEPRVTVFAPGRANLIGEHIDYVGGSVLPIALTQGISVAARLTMDPGIRVYSDAFANQDILEISPYGDGENGYDAFVKAAAAETGQLAAEIVIASDLPLESGLSSSAALCVALIAALVAVSSAPVVRTPLELIKRSQRAEKRATGVDCGIMDQYASIFGRQGAAVLIDTLKFDHELIPLALAEAGFVLANSGQPRNLADSGYNQRRQELETAFENYRSLVGSFESFRDLDPNLMLTNLMQLDDTSLMRLRHVITEQQRVMEFTGALDRGDADSLGMLLSESHQSLADDFQASTTELDQLTAQLGQQAGVYGARLMGGGFGGSVIALVGNGAVPDRVEAALDQYERLTGLTPSWNKIAPGDGARIWLGAAEPIFVTEWLK